MASQTIESLGPVMKNLEINNENDKNMSIKIDNTFDNKWGLPLDEVYKLALRFYKEKDGTKAVQLSYKDRIKLVAYTKQVLYGKYRTDVSPEVGFLDVVGNDRRQAWMSLGDISRSEAMSEFIKYLDQLCPLFLPYVDAHKAEKEEQLQKQKDEEERLRREEEEKERIQVEDEVRRRQEDDRTRQMQQEMAIRAALNQQTALQFKQYAEQQCPGNNEQQEALIVQLQEQHFQQYMQQVYQQQLLHQQQQQQQLQNMTDTTQTQPEIAEQQPPAQTVQVGSAGDVQEVTQVAQAVTGNGIDPMTAHGAQVLQNNVNDAHTKSAPADGGEEENEQNLPPIAAASMWTRKDVKEFKESIRKDPDSLIKVGSGETITVRVPTHEDGTCLFWEFATDNYDIGFGVYFEWTIAPNNQVSVHVSESSDEDELDEEEGESRGGDGDVERGKKSENRPPTDEIIPVYRRDCHQEVYCGSHMYPGRGVYLLKFDNSYSLWRSKCLYYRVYYTR